MSNPAIQIQGLSLEFIEVIEGDGLRFGNKTYNFIPLVFEEFVDPQLLKILHRLRITEPTKIQGLVFSYFFKCNDHLQIRSTNGTGKTLAYLLPIIVELSQKVASNSPSPQAIILVPTRLLAYQVYQVALTLLTENNSIRCVCSTGGSNVNTKKINKGCDILICTLGRLVHFCKDKVISLERMKYFVVDEADTVLCPKTEQHKHLRGIISESSRNEDGSRKNEKDWRMILSGSTLCHKYEDLMPGQPITRITFGLKNMPPPNIKQDFIFFKEESERLGKFCELIPFWLEKHKQIIVFTSSKDIAKAVHDQVKDTTSAVLICNSDEDNIDKFRESYDGKFRFLITVTFCSRGLNFPYTDAVVNYNLSFDQTEYIHRLGRCIHAGNHAFAYTLFCKKIDVRYAQYLLDILEGVKQETFKPLETILGVKSE